MTPACKLLDKNRIEYTQHSYEHDPNVKNFGLEAAEKLGLAEAHVFKTLMITDDKNFYIVILPVNCQLNLKKAAQAFGTKKIHLADQKDAERITGYLVGGISPIGQKKRLKTVIDQSAETLQKIYVSGGKRGFDIGLNPFDLSKILSAPFMDVIDI